MMVMDMWLALMTTNILLAFIAFKLTDILIELQESKGGK